MKDTIETRELFVLKGFDGFIRGTYHKPRVSTVGMQPEMIDRKRVGILFLTSMSPTRAANGDSAVYFADSLAEYGFPVIRLDLPGFGDSDGDPPAELHAYINRGGYASIASAKIRDLVIRFKLLGVIIVGHCAGAVSALYTAAASDQCKGIVLMAPYFYLPQNKQDKSEHQPRVVAEVYGHELPQNANVPLLHCWKELIARDLPILMLKKPERKSPEMKARSGAFDYLEYVLTLAGQRSRVVVKLADGADHSFSNRIGREAVKSHVEDWLGDNFPFIESADSGIGGLLRESDTEGVSVGAPVVSEKEAHIMYY